MTSVFHMREALKKFYSPAFHKRVDAMKDNQVIAIYRKFQAEGRIK